MTHDAYIYILTVQTDSHRVSSMCQHRHLLQQCCGVLAKKVIVHELKLAILDILQITSSRCICHLLAAQRCHSQKQRRLEQ